MYKASDLLDFLSDCCEEILLSNPNSKIIIAGDINQLDIKDLTHHHAIQQIVKAPTRGQNTLDVFLTNCPLYWKTPSVFQGLVRSDHLAVLVLPRITSKPIRKFIYFRDVREHRKIEMERKLADFDWSSVSTNTDLCESVRLFNATLMTMFNDCFPLKKVKVSSRDPPYMSPLVKHLCNIRNKNIRNFKSADNFILQERINKLIRENQVQAVKNENRKSTKGTKSWWDTVNKMTGKKNQGIPISSIIPPELINAYFKEMNTDGQYLAPQVLPIPNGTPIPRVDENTVKRFLTSVKRTASGPDEFPYWLWKDYGQYLAPVITRLFNRSLEEQYVPQLWKLANIRPAPKESPISECNQLRPISLTNIIMRIFERIVYKQELSKALKTFVGRDQFAYKECHNTTMALIKCQHNWLKWLDKDMDFVRIFSFDFSKAFDSVSHQILCNKLKTLNINPFVTNWIISFLTDRKQRVIVDDIHTKMVSINRGVPQGTVLGPVLFSIMVNDITAVYPDRNLLIKFADDIILSIPIQANSPDPAPEEVDNIKQWSIVNRMSLNLTKTWETVMKGKTRKQIPEKIPEIERKSELKLLGVTFSSNPCNWDTHIDSLLHRAASRLYILRVCKFYGYSDHELTSLFDSLIMSLFLYAIEVWGCAFQDKYISRFDKFCKHSLRFGYTSKQISFSNIIADRDRSLWNKLNNDPNHCLKDLLPERRRCRSLRNRRHNYILPQVRTERFKRCFINRCLFKF